MWEYIVYVHPMLSRGSGKQRGIAFGGGGEWFVAWTLSFLAAAKHHGVDLGTADTTVGTSAGSIVGALLTDGRLWRGSTEMDVLASHPALLARMVKTSTGHASQRRAADLLAEAKSTDREVVVEIGRAAMASRNAPVDAYERSLHLMLGHGDWPSPAHHVTAVDCYTGERVVIDHRSGIPRHRVRRQFVAAWGQRTSVDRRPLLHGRWHRHVEHTLRAPRRDRARRDLLDDVAHLGTGRRPDWQLRFAERVHPGTARREADELASAGTRTLLVAANPDPAIDFMDPAQLAGAIRDGRERATSMIEELAAVWR